MALRTFARARPLLTFTLLAYGLSWGLSIPLVLAARGTLAPMPEGWDAALAFGPAIAACIVIALLDGAAGVRAFLRRCLDLRLPVRAWFLAVGLPVAFFVAAFALARLRTGAWPALPVTTGVAAATAWWVPVALGALSGPGEEPGWRGFVLPRLLERHARLAATLRVAAVWIPWHLPMFLYRADFGPGAFVAFSLALLCGAIWLTEIHIAAGGSPFAAIAWHAVWNALAITARALEPSIFPVMTLGVLAGAGLVLWRWRRTASGRP